MVQLNSNEIDLPIIIQDLNFLYRKTLPGDAIVSIMKRGSIAFAIEGCTLINILVLSLL